MFLVGFVFGIGVDTAAEVLLLAGAASAATEGLPWFAVLTLPLLFAGGMTLFDSLDGLFMNRAYGWASARPARRAYYNLMITGRVITYPGVAPVASQQGRYAAQLIRDRLEGRPSSAFRYHSKANVATIGRRAAVVDLGCARLSGTLAWLGWLLGHLCYLIGFQSRLLVLIRWQISFCTRGPGTRLITAPAVAEVASRPGVPAGHMARTGARQS